jgi:GAF domain-containing protein
VPVDNVPAVQKFPLVRPGETSDTVPASVIRLLSIADSLEQITHVLTQAARELLNADGVTVVLRDGDLCHYVDEDAIGPLWKGRRFPLSACVSGWCMLNKQPVVIPDISKDARVPADAYRPTFVRSLAMAPIGQDSPIGALAAYWATNREASLSELGMLQTLANCASLALGSLQGRKTIAGEDERWSAAWAGGVRRLLEWISQAPKNSWTERLRRGGACAPRGMQPQHHVF